MKEPGLLNELREHLQQLGIKATVLDPKSPEYVGQGNRYLSRGGYILGCVRVEGRNIDLIQVQRGIAGGQNAPGQFLYLYEYIVRANLEGAEKDLKARIHPIKRGFLRRKVIDITWKGGRLAQQLNSDTGLKKMQLGVGLFNMAVFPQKKLKCVKIVSRPSWSVVTLQGIPVRWSLTVGRKAFPSPEAFEVYDRIAQHARTIAPTRPILA